MEIVASGSGSGVPTTYEVRVTLDVNNTGDNSFSLPLPDATDTLGRGYSNSEANSLWRRDLSARERYTAVVAYAFPADRVDSSNSLKLNLKLTASGASPVPTRDVSADATATAAGTSVFMLGPAVFQDVIMLDGIQLP